MPSEDFSSNGAVLPLSESLNVKGPSCRLHHDSGLDSDTANQGSSPPTALLIHTQDSTLDDSLTLSRVHCEIKNREAPPQEGLGPLPKTTLPYIPDSNDQDSSRSAHLLNYIWLLFVKVIDLPQDKSVNYTLHQGGYGSLQFLSSTSSSLSQTLYELTQHPSSTLNLAWYVASGTRVKTRAGVLRQTRRGLPNLSKTADKNL